MTNNWSVSRQITSCKKRYQLEARDFLLGITENRMYQSNVPQMFTFVQD